MGSQKKYLVLLALLHASCITGQDPGGETGNCLPSLVNACASDRSFCDASTMTCAACPGGTFNCDGVNSCEQSTPCTPQCSESVANACGGENRFCDVQLGDCANCPTSTFNCDGINNCERGAPCDSRCSPTTANDCGDEEQFCASGSQICLGCASGTFNCDGINDCESNSPCVVECNGCREDERCDDGTCVFCPARLYNCDNDDVCEATQPCSGPTARCDTLCQVERESLCVMDPSDRDRCVECLESSHCEANSRASGLVCDERDRLCTCLADSDCRGLSVGPVCKLVGGTTICGCDTDRDCVGRYSVCQGQIFRQCDLPCLIDRDCDEAPGGICEFSGHCSYALF